MNHCIKNCLSQQTTRAYLCQYCPDRRTGTIWRRYGQLAVLVVTMAVRCAEQVPKLLWTRKGVRATVVTAGHCTHIELTSGNKHALASC